MPLITPYSLIVSTAETTTSNEFVADDLALSLSPDCNIIFEPPSINSNALPTGMGASFIRYAVILSLLSVIATSTVICEDDVLAILMPTIASSLLAVVRISAKLASISLVMVLSKSCAICSSFYKAIAIAVANPFVALLPAAYVLIADAATFLLVPPAPLSIINKSASATASPISEAPSISNADNDTLSAVDIVANLVSAIAALDLMSAFTMLVIVLLSESIDLFVNVVVLEAVTSMSLVNATVPAVDGKVNVTSDVDAGPISVTLFVPLSLSSKNSKNPALVAPFFNCIPAFAIGVVRVLLVNVCEPVKVATVESIAKVTALPLPLVSIPVPPVNVSVSLSRSILNAPPLSA